MFYDRLLYPVNFTNMRIERIESLAEILEECGVVATEEQIKTIAEDFSSSIEFEQEMDSYGHIDHNQTCDECEKLKRELESVRGENVAYRDFIKKEKKASNVWVNRNGAVEGTYR